MGAQFWLFRGRSGDFLCFPGSLASKESASNVGDTGFVPGLGRSPGEWRGYPLQYSYLENRYGQRNWWAIDHRVVKSATRLGPLSTAQHSGESQELGHHPLFGLL